MANKFLELISSPLMNLDHTYRYSGTKLVESESLSQHIVDTIMMGLKVIDNVNYISGHTEVSPEVYLMKAVCHDLEEVITGDIPRPLKYYDEDTTKSMKHVAEQVARKFFSSQFTSGMEYYAVWDSAKDGKEGYILKIVDTLVVVNKVLKEVSLLHNYYMLRVAHEVSHYIREHLISVSKLNIFSERAANNYIYCLLEDALASMESVLKENQQTMVNFNIHSQSML